MQLVHSLISVPEKVKKPTKKEAYHAEMQMALRRRRYVDYQSALNDPEVIEKIKEVQKVSPGWQPKFRF